jgi:hypothetical protein
MVSAITADRAIRLRRDLDGRVDIAGIGDGFQA